MGGREGIVWRMGTALVEPRFPLVMGVINTTPDSFHAASRHGSVEAALRTAERMLADGAMILDVGAASTRPGAAEVALEEERTRVVPVIKALHARFPQAIISIDTWRAGIAEEAVKAGASMVNDISAGGFDVDMLTTVAGLNVPYVIMHMQGTPGTMQRDPHYEDVLAEVLHFLSERVYAAKSAGIADVLVDPGFGFGKNTAHNFALLNGLSAFGGLGLPVVVGLSRKRMINDVLGTRPAEALNGTTVLNTKALLAGADILRVHDVREAMEAVKLTRFPDPV